MAAQKNTTTNSAAQMIQLLGAGIRHKSVSLTKDEFDSLRRYYQYHAEDNKLLQAGADKNCCKAIEHDGMRVMAAIAKYLEPLEDPVRFVQQLMVDAGYDVQMDEDPLESEWDDE